MMKRVLLIALFLTLPTLAFASAYEVHTWGYGDLMYNVIKAIKILIGSGSYERMAQIALLIGALVAVLSLMNAKDFSVYMVAQKIVAGILLYTFIIATPHDMIIRDHVNTKNAIQHIDKVPAMIGFPLMLFSNLERGASEIFRTSLASAPGALEKLGSVPVVTGYDLLYTTSNYRIQDPNFNRTMNEFVQNCVYPDVLTGFIDIGDLASSDTFWGNLNNTHPARISGIFKAGASGIDGELKSCPEVYNHINTTLNNYVAPNGTASKQLAGALGYLSADTVSTIIGTISKDTFNYQQSGQNFMRNAIAMNSFNDAYIQTAKQVGMDPSGIAYGVAKGTETSATQMTLSGIMAKKYMPISKGFMTVIMVALIPLIVLIGLATSSIRKPVGMVVGILTALSLWAIGSQLLDFFIMIRTKSLMAGVTDVGGTYSIMTKPIVEQGILDSINMAMSMYWMIPTLSFAVASMSGYSASQMMSGVGATANSAIGGASGEVATGSQSMGVIRNNMMSMNKYDGVSSLRGGHTTQLSNIDSVAGKNDREMTTDSKISDVDSFDQRTAINTQNSQKHGETYENIHSSTNATESTYKGKTNINGVEGSGEIKKVGDIAYFKGELGGKEVTQLLAGADVDMNNGTISGGHNINRKAESGSSENINDGVLNLKAGADATGYMTAPQIVKNGLSDYSGNSGALETIGNNYAQHWNSEVSRSGDTQYTEQQMAKVAASVKAGIDVFGMGANVSAEASASLSRTSNTSTSVDYNQAVARTINNALETGRANGAFDTDGKFDRSKYDNAAREMYGAVDKVIMEEMGVDRGPGSLVNNSLDNAGKVIDKGKEAGSKLNSPEFQDTPKNEKIIP